MTQTGSLSSLIVDSTKAKASYACKEACLGKLDGKVVIVTGASRGIGAEIARVFAAEGGKVICSARTVKEGTHPLEGSLEKIIGDIQAAGGAARGWPMRSTSMAFPSPACVRRR